jgi:C1A family cysteine protease
MSTLDDSVPVVLGLVITDAFFHPTGGVVLDLQPDAERAGHAVLAVGYGASTTGDSAILVRNSWGLGWGLGGYAWLSSAYVSRQLFETATLT